MLAGLDQAVAADLVDSLMVASCLDHRSPFDLVASYLAASYLAGHIAWAFDQVDTCQVDRIVAALGIALVGIDLEEGSILEVHLVVEPHVPQHALRRPSQQLQHFRSGSESLNVRRHGFGS